SSDGRCVIPGAPDVPLGVVVSASGFLMHAVPAVRDSARPATWTAEPRLERGFDISGRLLDAAGAPAGHLDFVFTISTTTERPVERPVETNADGTFRFEDLGAGV